MSGFIDTVAKASEVAKMDSNQPAQRFDVDKRIDVEKNKSNDAKEKRFDPDKRIDVANDAEPSDDNHSYSEKKTNDSLETSELPFNEVSDCELYTKLEDRVEQASYGDGTWSGEPGQSEFTPNDLKAKKALENKGTNCIQYDKNGEPNFHPVSEGTVKIDNMTANRFPSFIDENGVRHVCNFEQADIKLADQWNAECKDGKTDWNKNDVNKWVKENNLTRHECLDKETMEYVNFDIHKECKHYGGVAECKARDMNNAGGKFDV